jgi:capsular polysaccharide biosynthesis protein
VELHEAIRRVLLGHWRLILSCVVVAVAAVTFMHRADQRTYTASSRLVLDTQDPQTRFESVGIADTAKAIATSPAQLQSAVRNAHVGPRDVTDLAQHVTVQALGMSGVLELSVADPEPRAAAAIANALAGGVLQTRLEVTQGHRDELLNRLDERLAAINRTIAATDPRRDAATADRLGQRRSALESERLALVAAGAGTPAARVISAAGTPTKPDPSDRITYLVLAVMLGLILGVGLAAVLETLRPTLASGEAIAAELDAPLLGTLSRRPGAGVAPAEAVALAQRLRLAAKSAGMRSVRLLAARADIDLGELSERLETAPVPLASNVPSAAADRTRMTVTTVASAVVAYDPGGADQPASASIRPFELDSAITNGAGTGLVLVAPDRLRKTELGTVRQLLRITPAPLLGVVAYRRRRLRRLHRARRADEPAGEAR